MYPWIICHCTWRVFEQITGRSVPVSSLQRDVAFGMKHLKTKLYHPQTNVQVEQLNMMIIARIRRNVADRKYA